MYTFLRMNTYKKEIHIIKKIKKVGRFYDRAGKETKTIRNKS